jgi:hypothetical protein
VAVDHELTHGMENHRAMRVDHRLGLAGGAAGETDRGGVVLVDPVWFRGLVSRDQVLVAGVVGEGGSMSAPSSITTKGLDGESVPQRGKGRGQRGVDEDDLISGVADDIFDDVAVEPHVDGVEYPPRARSPVVELEMTVAVPGEAGHGCPRGGAEGVEGGSETQRALTDLGPGPNVDAGRLDRGDGHVGTDRHGPAQDQRDVERDVLHQASHG